MDNIRIVIELKGIDQKRKAKEYLDVLSDHVFEKDRLWRPTVATEIQNEDGSWSTIQLND